MPELAVMETNDQSAPMKATIGIIYPPPEVRNIVDKTASFVARNGPEFESRIRQNEINNPKFNFLVPNDPYNAYYVHKVKEFKEGRGLEPSVPKLPVGLASLGKPQPEAVKLPEPVVPTEPPPEYEFIADPPSIATFDLDVVKLTAQFVARNGRQFLTNLMNREQRNYQFDFLRPQHSLFNYFTKLVEQYTKILIPPKELAVKLKKESENPKEILDQVKYRVDWARYQEREKQKEEAAIERERVAYAQIDWHDFVVVETVDFIQHESGNLPPPTTPDEVGARIIAQERFEAADDIEMDVESGGEEAEDEDEAEPEMEELEEDVSEPPPPPPVPAPPPLPVETPSAPKDPLQPPPLPPMPEKVIVRKDYDPKAAKSIGTAGDSYLISPITGERIPADKIAEHVRIGLLDPKWIEQRDRSISEKRVQEEVFAPGTSIAGSLRQLSERRTDIFGVGGEETQIGKKIGEEETKRIDKVTWDGHTASMEKVSQRARENISIGEQIALIHKVQGLVPDQDKEKIGPALPSSSAPRAPVPRPPPKPVLAPQMPKRLDPPPKPALISTAPAPQPQVSIARAQVSQPQPVPMARAVPMAPTPVMVMPAAPMMRPPSLMSVPTPVPPMPMAAPILPRPVPVATLGPPLGAPPMMDDDEPPSKKARSEESLMPEDQWAMRFPGPVTIQVMTPNMPEKTDYKLTGQTLIFTLPISDSVSVIKAKLHEELGMPAGKQKLSYDGLFMKDANTLAYYNLIRGAAIQLQLKERGGRKK